MWIFTCASDGVDGLPCSIESNNLEHPDKVGFAGFVNTLRIMTLRDTVVVHCIDIPLALYQESKLEAGLAQHTETGLSGGPLTKHIDPCKHNSEGLHLLTTSQHRLQRLAQKYYT